MINIIFFYREENLIGFKITGHDRDYICSAVSMIVINTINCIEKFTSDKFSCDYDKKNGGLIDFEFINKNNISHDAKLLIKSLEFGLKEIYNNASYKKFIKIREVNKID